MTTLIAAKGLLGAPARGQLVAWRVPAPFPLGHAAMQLAMRARRRPIPWPVLVAGLLALVMFVLFVQAVQFSMIRGESLAQDRRTADLARVAHADAVRDAARLPVVRGAQVASAR